MFYEFIMRFVKTLVVAVNILILPSTVIAQSRVINVEWQYKYSGYVAGFRLYHENKLVCETNDPKASSMICSVDAPDGESMFTITSFLTDKTESPHSSIYLYIFSRDLKASFDANTFSGQSPLSVTFNAISSTGSIILYEWMFGDGETGTGDTVNHTFTSAGDYNVTLKITDNKEAVDMESAVVIVTPPTSTNTPPVAVISSSKSVGDAPLPVQFDGTGSSDSDGIILGYKWDTGDGGIATSPRASHTYYSPGTFHLTLTVTDDGGLKGDTSTPVIVTKPHKDNNIPPVALISISKNSGKKPFTVFFDAGKSNDPDGKINHYSWNFGDGTYSTSITASHTYLQTGVYTATLKVTDNLGASSQLARHSISVLDSEKEKASFSLPAIFQLLMD